METVTDKSMKLLAQRHAELQGEFLGEEILQSSKQFQRISKRTMRKYKLRMYVCHVPAAASDFVPDCIKVIFIRILIFCYIIS